MPSRTASQQRAWKVCRAAGESAVSPLSRASATARQASRRKIAHLRRPEFVVEFDESLEFAQVMGVAERMGGRPGRPVQIAVRFEAVMDDHAALEPLGHFAALVAGAIEGKRRSGHRMQPLRLAADPPSAFTEGGIQRSIKIDLLQSEALTTFAPDGRRGRSTRTFRMRAIDSGSRRRASPRCRR
jgi:hypothetical protein